LNAVAALCVPSTSGAVQVTLRPVPAPCARVGAAGAFGTPGAVARVAIADHGLLPAAFVPCTWTSIAAPADGPDSTCGLVTLAAVVQMSAPDGLDWRLYPVAAPWALSATGAVQVTVRFVPGPCARERPSGDRAFNCETGIMTA
jgi:hypothetical protein